MESKNIKELIDQLIDRLNHYQEEHAIIAHVPSKYELEVRIKKLKKQIETLRNLPLEQQNQINSEELEKLLGSLPFDFNEFEWQKFDKPSSVFIENSKNVLIGNTIIAETVQVGDIYNQPVQKKINSILTKLPYNEKFEGRKKELSLLKEQIATHKSISLISINGIGGIGKSALSKAFFLENYKEYDFALFLEGKSNVYDTFNDNTLLDNLGIAEKVHSIPYQTPNRNEIVFDIIKNALSNLEGKKLLLIDDASENSHLLKGLPSAGWDILTTSRQKIDFMESFELKQATPDDAVAIFCVYYGQSVEDITQKEKEQIQNIVNRLAFHPLAIELVAKNIKRKDWTFEETNQKLAEKGLNIDEKTNLSTTHSQEKIKDIFEYLLQLFPLENLTEEELKLLNVYSVLPNLPITKQTWKTLLGENEDHWQELSTGLNERGLINKNEKAFEIHALLAEIVRYKNEDRLSEDCEKLMDSLIDELHYQDNIDYHKENYKYTSLYSTYSESIANNIEDSEAKGILYERIGGFYQKLGNLKIALEFFKKFNDLENQFYIQFPNDVNLKNRLAISYLMLGQTNKELGNLKIALDCFNKSNNLMEKIYKEFPKNIDFKVGIASSYSRLGNTYQELGNIKLTLDFFQKSSNLMEQIHKEFPKNIFFKSGLAISYQDLGRTYQEFGFLKLALEFFEKYNDLEKQLHNEFPNNVNFKNELSTSYQFLGNVHQELENLKLALEFFEKYNDLEKQLYIDFPKNINFKTGMAISYQKLGGINQKLGNLTLALNFFEKDLELKEQLCQDFPQNVIFKNGLAISCQFLGLIHQELENTKIAFIFFEKNSHLGKQLYQEFPNNVNFKAVYAASFVSLGQTQKKLGNHFQAKNYYLQAETLHKELVSDFPSYPNFQKNLAFVRQQLEKLQ